MYLNTIFVSTKNQCPLRLHLHQPRPLSQRTTTPSWLALHVVPQRVARPQSLSQYQHLSPKASVIESWSMERWNLKHSTLHYFGGRYVSRSLVYFFTQYSWQIHHSEYPVHARMARDFLAIPGAMVSVERLFSRSRHLCTDQRSSLKAATLTQAMCTKEWLREGLMRWDWGSRGSNTLFALLGIFFALSLFINCLYSI